MPYTNLSITPLGDAALIINFENIINKDISKKVLQLFHQLKVHRIMGIIDIIPAYSSITIHYDVTVFYKKTPGDTVFQIMYNRIIQLVTDFSDTQIPLSRIVKIPVCYAEEFAMDIREISNKKKIPVDEIIHLHTSRKYRVYMIGFLPGFAYMGEVDERIAMPRKLHPRNEVAAGSVGIAGMQTGVYPLDSPGGWQIIGRTPLQLFDKEKTDPVLLQPGDEIKFYSITEDEFANY